MLQGPRNKELPLAFVFPVFAVIHVDYHFEPFSVFSFLHAKDFRSKKTTKNTNVITNEYPKCFGHVQIYQHFILFEQHTFWFLIIEFLDFKRRQVSLSPCL